MSKIATLTRLLLIGITLFISFFPALSTNAQTDPNDPTWLDSPTYPRKTCGAAWGMNNPAGGQSFHNAVDFCGAGRGKPIYVVADGIVVYVGWWPKDTEPYGHGEIIGVWHPRNRIYTYYAHTQKQFVVVGQEVKKGETIGEVGSTGAGTGPHVHLVAATKDPATMRTVGTCGSQESALEIKKGKIACFPNPLDFLGKDVVAQDLGIISYSPEGVEYKPANGTLIYTGGLELDGSEPEIFYEAENISGEFTGNVPENQDNDSFIGAIAPPEKQLNFLSPVLAVDPLVIWIFAVIFVACFATSERFRHGIFIIIVIAGVVLIIVTLLPR